MFLAVGDAGTILKSPDGTNWTTQASGVTTHLYSVQFGDSLFVAVGYNVILTSKDGLSWTTQTSGLPFQTSFIAYGNGLFVLEGSTGTNVISTNGTNWFARHSGTDQGLYAMGFGDGVFLSIDLNLRTFISSDASNWVQRTSVSVGRPAAVVFGNGHFVTGGSGGMEYSSSSSAWTLASAACLPRGICFGNGTFVAVGYAEAIVQSDPVVWLRIHSPGTVEIFGSVGKNYSVDSMDTISGADWMTRTNIALFSSPCLWSDPDIPQPSQRFYRVVMQP